ncbi:MAG: hypothetical protein M3N49_08430 [Candidatus Eremiobacteraeota bacterium]|nr:hypothetical protein [Candidatus Eremiobacteraeota bacterium]
MRCFVALLALVLAGCGGGGGAASAPPAPLPPCSFNESVFGSTTLVYPADRARGVSTTIGSVAVTYMAELVGVTVTLVPSPTSPPSPVISGGRFGFSVSGTTLAASIPVVSPATDYSVQATTQRISSTCTETVGYYLGSFST